MLQGAATPKVLLTICHCPGGQPPEADPCVGGADEVLRVKIQGAKEELEDCQARLEQLERERTQMPTAEELDQALELLEQSAGHLSWRRRRGTPGFLRNRKPSLGRPGSGKPQPKRWAAL